MTLIAVLLRIFDFLHTLFTKANVLPNVIDKLREAVICLRPSTPHAAAQHALRLRRPACLLLPVTVGAMNIHNVRKR